MASRKCRTNSTRPNEVQPCEPCSTGMQLDTPMKARAPPIGWLILSGLTAHAFLDCETTAMAPSRRLRCRKGARSGDRRDFFLTGAAARPGARDRDDMVEIAVLQGVLDLAEADIVAAADACRAAGLLGASRIGGQRCGLGLDRLLGALLPARLLPGRRQANLLPDRIAQRLVDLGDEFDHAFVAGIGMMALLVDVEPGHLGLERDELRTASRKHDVGPRIPQHFVHFARRH